MRILLIVSSYLPNLGGLQRVSSSLAVELQRRGHTVLVLTNRYPRNLPGRELIDGVHVRRLQFLIPRLLHVQNGRADLALAGLFFCPTSFFRLLGLITQFKPDVVNFHFIGAPAPFVVLAHKLLRFHLVVSLHGDDVEGYARGTWFDRWSVRATLEEADAVTACSQYLLKVAETLSPAIAKKSTVVHNGLEPLKIASNGSKPESIVAAGRLFPSKGFDVLVQAMRQVNDLRPSLPLIIFGQGPEHVRLQEQVESLDLTGSVELCGPVDRERVHQAMQKSRLVVVPSRHESFGMVALEALSQGRPVVATRVGGLPELLHDADALLVEPENPNALATAIVETLIRLEHEPEFGARNRELAAKFSVDRMVRNYLNVYSGAGPLN